jgi:hypothetical protein
MQRTSEAAHHNAINSQERFMNAASTLDPKDHAEITTLYAYYNLCSDAGDAEGYASCFTEDGLLNLATLGFTRRGRAALIEFKQKDAAGRNGRYRRHWNGSLHLEAKPDGDVQGRCYFIAFNGTLGQLPELSDAGTYVDTIKRENGAWKFAERQLSMDGTTFRPPE